MKLKEAFSEQTFNEIFTPWLKSIDSRECLSVINIPKRDQLYRIDEFTKKVFRDKNTQVITLDLKGEIIEDASDLNDLITKKINKKSAKTALAILDSDQLLNEKTALLSYLDKLYHDNPKLSLIYLFQTNIGSVVNIKKLSRYTTLYQNINVYRYLKPDEIKFFLQFIQAYFKVSIPTQVAKQISTLCGGNPWLVKEAVRYYYQTGDTEKLFQQENMQLKLNILYQELSDEEKTIVEKIIKKDTQSHYAENSTIEYLLRTGLLLQKNSKYEISIPLLRVYIQKIINEKTLISLNQKKQLILNGILIDSFFSRREKRTIKLLLENKGKILAREKLAEEIWLNNDPDSYTDWALDQLIRRLRIKLVKLGLNRNLIKTVKNQGYLFP